MAVWAKALPTAVFVGRCAGSAVGAYLVAMALALPHPVWALISAVVVAQENLAETWTSTGRRIAGTLLGVAIGVAIDLAARPLGIGIAVQVVLTVGIGAVVAHERPGLRVGMWTGPIVLLTGDANDPAYLTGLYRGSEVILGALLGGAAHWAAERVTTLLIDARQRFEGKAVS